MINKITSSIPTFKEVVFHEGMNILVTKKTEKSTSTNTRNGSGKSSLIDIIHFLFGSSIEKNSIFNQNELENKTFTVNFTINNIHYSIERNTTPKSQIKLITHIDSKKIVEELPLTQMNKRFAEIIFGITDETDGISFRNAFSYFLRQENAGGFLDPFEIHKKQNKISKQSAITFLLGLNTKITSEWKELAKKDKELASLKRILKNKSFNIIKTEAEITSSSTILEEKIKIFENQLKNFQVLPKYRELENQANNLTELINDATNQIQINKLQISDIEKSLDSEQIQSNLSLQELYNEVNIVLPEKVLKRFNDVDNFHKSVISNRKNYLLTEIEELNHSINKLNADINFWSNRREQIMQTLQNKGALDQYSKIQEEMNTLKSEYQTLQQQLMVLQSIDITQEEISIKENDLQKRLNQDFIDNEETIKKAILSFSHAAQFLYGEDDPAKIIIDKKGKDGINFEIVKSDKKSKGINNMMVFCFDMMLMEMNFYLERPLDFMVHDSHLFDGVDERQISLALEYAKLKTEEFGFQYITMLNSDIFDSINTDFEKEKLDLDISDASENGGLFGFRF